ncbi:MAG: ATP-binding protein [Candidatus Omnitrophica bacterium]|nr:ATP-binding protein [Candidatus Omnitrophota bacterium]
MIERDIQLPRRHSFFLFGPRQTGKSTLLQATFASSQTLYYDLLKSEEYQRFSATPHLFREEVAARPAGVTHVIVDEIQRVPALLNEIHHILEKPQAPYFCLSGSSARKLKRSHANLLAGRAWTCRLFPLTSRELGSGFSLHKALNLGTLPSVYLDESAAGAQRTLRAYVETYLREEIEAEALTRNLGGFLRFLTLAADNNGQVINYSTIARECGVSYQTVKGYFQILEDTLIGFFLAPYARSRRKRLIQHPKFYFFDTGVARALQKTIGVELQPKTYEYGRIFEHFIVLEIMRLASYQELDYEFSFYRTSNQAEVDLIVETPAKKTYAIEIKASQQPEAQAMSGLLSFKEICPKAVLYCVSQAPQRRKIKDVTILPWRDIFSAIGIKI